MSGFIVVMFNIVMIRVVATTSSIIPAWAVSGYVISIVFGFEFDSEYEPGVPTVVERMELHQYRL